jgi:hypothetical protein
MRASTLMARSQPYLPRGDARTLPCQVLQLLGHRFRKTQRAAISRRPLLLIGQWFLSNSARPRISWGFVATASILWRTAWLSGS